MKKTLLAVILAVACVACLAACGGSEPAPAPAPETQSQAPVVASVPVMTHEEYVAAPLDSQVCVETYIQAKQGWWENQATIYTQAEDGAYFLYNMPCTEEDYNNVLTVGTKIKVTGFKSEWSGEVEIIDATYEVIEGETYIANPIDVTDLLGTDELIAHQNEFVSFKGLKVAASKDANGNDAAYLYNWDGSGSKGDDLYFNVEDAKGNVYQFTVESYLCGADTEVYQAVEALQIGQTVDLEGFLYWYEGVNPHITNVVVK
ncbi:MAG: hypothetical protein MJ086_02290 [Lachnospiraceae bacterium]|nr:hypothetical protein [Lachnospiraceae bacterium]